MGGFYFQTAIIGDKGPNVIGWSAGGSDQNGTMNAAQMACERYGGKHCDRGTHWIENVKPTKQPQNVINKANWKNSVYGVTRQEIFIEGTEDQMPRFLAEGIWENGYPRIWLALSLAELNLQLSFIHKEQPNKPTLVFDMIEEFRQAVVDRAVISLINRGEELKMDGALLTKETRDKVALAVLERLNTPLKFRGKNLSLAEIIHHQARHLANIIKDGGTYRPYLAKW